MKRNASVLSIVMALVVATVVVADQAEKIGQVRFPVSCSPAVQQPFERAGDREKARTYYGRLLATAASADSQRPELVEAKAFR